MEIKDILRGLKKYNTILNNWINYKKVNDKLSAQLANKMNGVTTSISHKLWDVFGCDLTFKLPEEYNLKLHYNAVYINDKNEAVMLLDVQDNNVLYIDSNFENHEMNVNEFIGKFNLER